MKQILRTFILFILSSFLLGGAVLAVSVNPDELDDYPVTHHDAGHPAGELQHIHSLHFDNLVYIHSSKKIAFECFSVKGFQIREITFPERDIINTLWQPPRYS